MRMHGNQFDMPIRGQHPPENPMLSYFPSVSDAARAVPIEVAAGAELRGFDVRLRRERAYSVRFKLPVNPSGNRYYNAEVTGGANTPRFGAQWTSDSMEVPGLPPGSYVVTITHTEGDKQSYARVPVEIVDADIDGGIPAFSPAIELTGTVGADDKKPHPWENIRVSLRSDANGPYNFPGSAVSSDGTFALHHLPPDTYCLTVQLTRPVPDTYVKSASIGDHELVDWKVDLTRENGVLHIQLGTDVATIEGAVKNAAGDPVVRARVNLIPYGNSAGRTDQTKFTFTDEKGEFNFKSVAPAQYRIFAWEDVELGRPQDPVFRKKFENQSALVKMAPNGHEKVELTAITAAAARKPEP
jgi:hypothetical protein